MSLKIGEKDKKLLVFLALVLILFGIGYEIAYPLFQKSRELSASIQEAQTAIQVMETKLNAYESIIQAREEKQKAVSACEEKFLEEMSATGVDNMLTSMAFEHQVVVQSLNIMMPTEPVTNLQSYQAGIYGEQEDESAEENSAFADVGTVGVSMTLCGTKENLQNILDLYVSMEPKIRATNIAWSLANENEGMVNINMDLYMLMNKGE